MSLEAHAEIHVNRNSDEIIFHNNLEQENIESS
jgi:hypothetical protein